MVLAFREMRFVGISPTDPISTDPLTVTRWPVPQVSDLRGRKPASPPWIGTQVGPEPLGPGPFSFPLHLPCTTAVGRILRSRAGKADPRDMRTRTPTARVQKRAPVPGALKL